MNQPIGWEDYQQIPDGSKWHSYCEQQAEIERLNAELATGKFREGAVCGYCSDSGSIALAEIDRLEVLLKETTNAAISDASARLDEIERLRNERNVLADKLAEYTGFPVPVELKKAAAEAAKGE